MARKRSGTPSSFTSRHSCRVRTALTRTTGNTERGSIVSSREIRPTRPDRRESPLGSYDHSSGAPATTIDHARRRERAASDFPAVMSEHCDEGAGTGRRFGRRPFSARRSITASTSYVARPSTIRTAAFFPDGRKIFPTERFTGSLVTRRWREMDSNHRYPAKFSRLLRQSPTIPIHLPQYRLSRDRDSWFESTASQERTPPRSTKFAERDLLRKSLAP